MTKINPASFRPLYPRPLFSGSIWTGIWNGTLFNDISRWCIRKLVYGLKWLRKDSYPPSGSRHITRITDHLLLKTTHDYAEANNLCFVRETTSVPVPRVYDAWQDETGPVTILMEWIDAVTLSGCWTTLSSEETTKISRQLGGFLDELRSLPQPPETFGRLGPPGGFQIFCPLIYSKPVGPFVSEKAFNDFLLSRVDEFMYDPASKGMADAIRAKMRDDHRIVFTHGDLSSRNILIDKDANVAALIDFEMGGWMPDYWEYATTIHLSPTVDYWIPFVEQITYHDDEAVQTVIYDFVDIRGSGPW